MPFKEACSDKKGNNTMDSPTDGISPTLKRAIAHLESRNTTVEVIVNDDIHGYDLVLNGDPSLTLRVSGRGQLLECPLGLRCADGEFAEFWENLIERMILEQLQNH